MSTRDDFNMLRCRDAESDSCDILIRVAYGEYRSMLLCVVKWLPTLLADQ
jgi:hypothetical protein